jgi:ABC-2 type transport system permease protein
LSDLIGENAAVAPYGGYLPFALIGMAVANVLHTSFNSFAKAIHWEQLQGTLESLMITPLPLWTVIVGCAAWEFLWTTLIALVYVVAAVALYDVDLQGSYLLAVALLCLTALAFALIGIVSASFVMVYKRGDPVALLMGGVSTLLGGVFYPVTALPPWLQSVAQVLPITHDLHAVREVLLRGGGIADVWPQLLVLLAFVGIGAPLAALCFRSALRRARRDGTLLQF